jgi:hypothetical protein
MPYCVYAWEQDAGVGSCDPRFFVHGFRTFQEADQHIVDHCLCGSCVKRVEEGEDPRETCCYDFYCIWTERRYRKTLNGSWWKRRRRKKRRQR